MYDSVDTLKEEFEAVVQVTQNDIDLDFGYN